MTLTVSGNNARNLTVFPSNARNVTVSGNNARNVTVFLNTVMHGYLGCSVMLPSFQTP